MQEVMLKQVKKTVQGHVANKWWNQEVNQESHAKAYILNSYAIRSTVPGTEQQPGNVWGKDSPERPQNIKKNFF